VELRWYRFSINHIPGIHYERLTYRNLSISDAAELFVLRAGWSLRYLVGSSEDPIGTPHLVVRLESIARSVPWLLEPLSILGRNSLNVFCAASLLSLGAQIVRLLYSVPWGLISSSL
jgi:hypothetical protein